MKTMLVVKKIFPILITWAFISLTYAKPVYICNGIQVLGNVEHILLYEKNKTLTAKLDTGAEMSSLSALNIHQVNRQNKIWIQFDVLEQKTGKITQFIKPLKGYSHILKRAEESKTYKKEYGTRPVILMDVCLGHQKKQIEVNLIDRTQFKYPMLIGVQAIKKFNVLIDANQKYLSEPNCS